MLSEKVLFIGDGSHWSALAADYTRAIFDDVDTVFWDYGNTRPTHVDKWSGDRVFCFKADLILKTSMLARAARSAINFHPSIPRYRGIGGYDYVLHDGGSEFGVTCHHMVSKIDSGAIIRVQRFPIVTGETPDGLAERTAAYTLLLYYDILHTIRSGEELPVSDEEWGSTLYTRAMLEHFRVERSLAGSVIGQSV